MIYISGRITGNKDYPANFERGKAKLLQMGYREYQIVSPTEIKPYQGVQEWKSFMIADIMYLVRCKEIFMLKDWKKSKGARIERKIAKMLGLGIRYESHR